MNLVGGSEGAGRVLLLHPGVGLLLVLDVGHGAGAVLGVRVVGSLGMHPGRVLGTVLIVAIHVARCWHHLCGLGWGREAALRLRLPSLDWG